MRGSNIFILLHIFTEHKVKNEAKGAREAAPLFLAVVSTHSSIYICFVKRQAKDLCAHKNIKKSRTGLQE